MRAAKALNINIKEYQAEAEKAAKARKDKK